MKMRRWAALSGLIGSAAILLAACGGSTGTSTTQAPLQKENTIVTALPLQTAITDYAPIANASAYTIYNSGVEYMMWAPVVMVSGSDTIDWADSLASKITTNANDTQYTVTLKNWNWSNGQPITAQDVAWTTNVLLAACTMKSPPYTYGGCGFGGLPPSSAHAVLTGATAQGQHTVVFTLNKSVNPVYFELNGLGQIQPMPQKVWDQGSYTATLKLLSQIYNKPNSPEYKVVSGPYKFKSMINDESYTFVPNPKYGGHKATATWVEQYEASDSAEFAALKKNQINAGYLTASMYGSASQLKGQYKQSLSQGFCWYGIELNSAPNSLDVGAAFQDQKVRQALEYGIDQNAIGKVLDGTLNGKQLWVPNYSAIPSGFAKLTQAVFGVSSIPNAYPFNPTQGKQVLQQDGWSLNSAGVMQKNGVQLKFPVFYDSGSTETANAAVILQQDWAKMGVKITPQPVAFDTLVAMSDSQGAAAKWAINWTGGWCYEPNFYPTGGGMWGYYDSQDDYNYTPFNQAVANAYLPGTPAQAQQRMLAYAQATAKDLPFLWQPGGYAVNEFAPYIHGLNKYFNPVQAFTMINWVTISH
jgi:peptide/nickel transport system substrate-binding protein